LCLILNVASATQSTITYALNVSVLKLIKEEKMLSDLLDEYCEEEFGHTDWSMDYEQGNLVITFHREPRQCYLDEMEESCEDTE